MIRVLFFGTPDFSSNILRRLSEHDKVKIVGAVTNPDRPAGRGKQLLPSPVKKVASDLGIPVIQPGNIKKSLESFIHETSGLGEIDVGVVVAFGQILPRAVLDLPKHGCVNIHASLLPRWRGAAPIQRAIMAGDSVTGVCLMQMEEGLDTGPVYSKIEVPIRVASPDLRSIYYRTAGELHDSLSSEGATLIIRDIEKIVSGELQSTPQSSEGVTYAEKFKNEDAKIDWTRSSSEICNHIHGLSPFPGAFTTVGGARLKIYRAYPIAGGRSVAPAGSITRCEGQELRIACAGGEVGLLDLQLEGRKRLEVSEFINGQSIHGALILGD